MPSSIPKNDYIRLRHMLEAAREAVGFAQGRTRADLEQSRLLAYGLIRCLEIIGEAAARMSGATREMLPSLPWQQIIGMRNRLIHAYFDVDVDMIWRTVNEDLPALISLLNQAVEQQPAR